MSNYSFQLAPEFTGHTPWLARVLSGAAIRHGGARSALVDFDREPTGAVTLTIRHDGASPEWLGAAEKCYGL